MRLTEERTGTILVTPDPTGLSVEVEIGGTATGEPRVLRLTREEVRRLAALLLFQAARLDRPRAHFEGA